MISLQGRRIRAQNWKERTRKTTHTGTSMSSNRSVMLMSMTAARLICSLGVGISPLGSLRGGTSAGRHQMRYTDAVYACWELAEPRLAIIVHQAVPWRVVSPDCAKRLVRSALPCRRIRGYTSGVAPR